MKRILFGFALLAFIACKSDEKQNDTATPAAETTDMGSGELKDGISDYTNNKKSFLLTCRIDASNSIGSENEKQVEQFCECAWEKTKGKYPGETVATKSKLEKDPLLKDCYESAIAK